MITYRWLKKLFHAVSGVPRLSQELYGSEYPLQNAWFQGPFYYEETGMKNMAKYFDNA